MLYQRESPRRLRVAMVGIGSHTYRNLLPALNFLPVELAAVCNRANEEEGRLTAAQYGCRYYKGTKELYARERLDAVFLCTSAAAQARQVEEAFAAGLHVFVEKPPAVNSEELRRLIGLRGGRVAVVGYKKAFMPAADKALEVVNDPRYGAPVSALAAYCVPLPKDGKWVLAEGQYTEWHQNSCHPLAFLCAVCGRPAYVTTHGSGYGAACVVEFENGVLATLHLAAGPQPSEFYHLYGEHWNLRIENSTRVVLNRGVPFDYGRSVSFLSEGEAHGALLWEPQNCLATLENSTLFVQGIYAEMRYFCDCVLEGRPAARGSLEFALQLMRLTECALQSEGARVAVTL